MRAIVYVDGLNLYYRALKRSKHKWLNIKAMAQALLDPSDTVILLNYYTAHVMGKSDPDAPKRQHAYLRALATIPDLKIHYGRFLEKEKCRPLVTPMPLVYPKGAKHFVMIHDSEEKGTDVNLASHLLRDGYSGNFDLAVVVSEDTDLVEPIRIVSQEIKKPIGLLCPGGMPSKHLLNVVTFHRYINTSILGASQLANPILDAKGKPISKPASW